MMKINALYIYGPKVLFTAGEKERCTFLEIYYFEEKYKIKIFNATETSESDFNNEISDEDFHKVIKEGEKKNILCEIDAIGTLNSLIYHEIINHKKNKTEEKPKK